ncbi:hypothetical protein [Methyloceanibacter caenitepidi]|uniref:Uncharacterized protein n=1 Tax=Methyloceanibacter caenitepidi TaxID=1384459 RepID=A0A0A8JZS4_9HYPH|nr:hypothetical protein [Methyloceanibacter caenitepidi]BAQ16070.1 hypothetical protein GL4_0607 [Methyloceanibacter caenitepidi]
MTVKVKKSDPPETKEILAEAITRIGEGFDALQKSGLNKKAIIILIQAETRLSQRDIRTVLDALPRLRGWYCR